MNSLSQESSPYLLQHKDNPVDWRIWSQETIETAKSLDKPILLSVGYAACHWCHVMASESFEDAETAELMNALFVPIKVDREERPDIDAIYQNALALMGQNGGWPLTMFLTPDGEPFWGGTYFPPQSKFGRPAFRDVLIKMAKVYREQKDVIAKNTTALHNGLIRISSPSSETVFTPETLDEISMKLLRVIDPVEGGVGQAPKFPNSPVLGFLWRGYKRSGDERMRAAVLLTLDRMSQGGIYDHLGGGYSRYSTDNKWLAPHFEKMLYDNAQLVELLTWGWQETARPLYAARVSETIAWMLREMRVEGSAFAAALDADSEHEEGKFYVWTADEIDSILGPEAAALFKAHYDVNRAGNWEGKTILNRSDKPELMDEEIEARLAEARQKLFRVRENRVRPARDHKVLADWNGLAISALCLASETFGRSDWLDAAKQAFDFVVTYMTSEDGRLFHSWCDGRTHPATLDDYAMMSCAALALWQATRETAYLRRAEEWVQLVALRYSDQAGGGFFFTADDTPNLIVRTRSAHDQATPSGNGVMLEVFATIYFLTNDDRYRARAEAQIGAFIGEAVDNSIALAAFLSGVDFYFNAVQIVVCAGLGLEPLLRAVKERGAPNAVLTLVGENEEIARRHAAEGRVALDNRATAYVCRGQTCSLPITDPDEIRRML